MKIGIERLERIDKSCMVPEPVPGEPSLFQIDATWGTIQPMQVAEGVCTIG